MQDIVQRLLPTFPLLDGVCVFFSAAHRSSLTCSWRIGFPRPQMVFSAVQRGAETSMPRPKANRIPLAEPGRSAILDANVLQFVRGAMGDPRLTWWEANFVNGMANWVAPTGPGAHLLTEKQWAIITQISAKLEAAPVEDLADVPEAGLAAEGEAPLPELAPVDDLD